MDPLIGQAIDGRFEVRSRLGQGGMGTVYVAYQRSVDREVAVKLMDPAFSRDPTAVRRFEREAQLASKLSQPNTVSVIDFGQAADGRLFIAMELIRGRTLHHIVSSEGAFSIERTARVATQICDALEAAHKLGIVHRDLKLDNIMILDEPPGRDFVKVLDFGLAKQVDDLDPRATSSGIVVGTPRYIAPEVATGGQMSPAADMYAVGVLVAELCTGRPLWESNSLQDLMTVKLAPRASVVHVPAALRTLVNDLVDADPMRRPSAAAVRERLVRIQVSPHVEVSQTESAATIGAIPRQMAASRIPEAPPTVASRPAAARPRSRRWLGIAIAVGVISLVSAVVVSLSSSPSKTARGALVDKVAHAPGDAAAFEHDPWETKGEGVAEPAAATEQTFVIVTDPPGATVMVQGAELGVAPVTVRLASGSQPVTLLAHWHDAAVAWTVIPDRDREITIHQSIARRGVVELFPGLHSVDASVKPGVVLVTITSEQPTAVAWLGRRVGTTPIVLAIPQSPISYLLDVTVAKVPRKLSVTAERDRTITLAAPTDPRTTIPCADCTPAELAKPTVLHVDTTGAPVELSILRRHLGTTPLDIGVKPGHPIILTATIDGADVPVIIEQGTTSYLIATD